MALRSFVAVCIASAAIPAALVGCDRAEADTASPNRPEVTRPAHEVELSPASYVKGELVPVTDVRLVRQLVPRAQEILEEHRDDPIGTEVPFEHAGRTYIARIEVHNHPYGGDKKPWGPHRGITVYERD